MPLAAVSESAPAVLVTLRMYCLDEEEQTVSTRPIVIAAATAAILPTEHLSDDADPDLFDQRLFVHPYVADIWGTTQR